jgi:hypothetical protein
LLHPYAYGCITYVRESIHPMAAVLLLLLLPLLLLLLLLLLL